MNKKAGSPIIPVVFTIAVLSVMILALFIFATNQNEKKVYLQSPEILDKVYSRESEINFYITQIMKNSTENLSPITKTQFLNNFKQELNKNSLIQLIPELEDIKPQLIESNVNILDDEIKIKIKIKIERIGGTEIREIAKATYVYEKTFTEKYSD